MVKIEDKEFRNEIQEGLDKMNFTIRGHCKKCKKWHELTLAQAQEGKCPSCDSEGNINEKTTVDCPLKENQLFSYCKRCFFHPQSDLYPNCVL